VVELLALSAAGNILLACKLLITKQTLKRAITSLSEVGAGRAKVIERNGKIEVSHKIITADKTNIC